MLNPGMTHLRQKMIDCNFEPADIDWIMTHFSHSMVIGAATALDGWIADVKRPQPRVLEVLFLRTNKNKIVQIIEFTVNVADRSGLLQATAMNALGSNVHDIFVFDIIDLSSSVGWLKLVSRTTRLVLGPLASPTQKT